MQQDLPPLPPQLVDDAVQAALDEDGAWDDITTRAVVSGAWGRGIITAKEETVVAGLPVAAAAVTALDETISFDTLVPEGQRVAAGTELAEVEGPVAAILSAERVALNFLQRLSGIATLTRAFVDAVDGTRARIVDTRKTTPGLRHLERYAVRVGGGHNHRFNLAGGVLIKDNHLAAIAQAEGASVIAAVVRARQAVPHTMKIEVEVTNLEQLHDALEARADAVLLDNMSVDQIRSSVEFVAGRAIVEASGGVTLENVRAIADAGVDVISVGRLTHSAPSIDISLEVQPI